MGYCEEGNGKSLSVKGRRRKIKREEGGINNTKDVLKSFWKSHY